jgi:hypothetical protein
MRPYAGIPHAGRPGLFVEENALLLRRYAYVEQRLCVLLAGHFPGTGLWELKHALARHSWEDAQHAEALRRRLITLRTSPRLLEECPDPALAALLDEAERAADPVELLAGVHGVIKPALLAAYRWHLETTNPVADFPTARELEIAVREEAHQLAWSAEALAELAGAEAAAAALRESRAAGGWETTSVAAMDEAPRRAEEAAPPAAAQGGPPLGAPHLPDPADSTRALAWQAHLRTFLAAAGGIGGREPRPPQGAEAPRAQRRFRISRHPQRDGRFRVNFQFHEAGDPPPQTTEEKLIFMMRGRLNELAATENVASAIYELGLRGAPWEALLELSRHMWDEARHSMLGQAVIESLGHDVRAWPLRIGPGYSYLSVGPLQRYAHLGLNVEQGMMKYPPGKRQEYEWCRDVARHRLAAMYQDYDWSDEVYHTQIARRWVSRLLGEREGDDPDASVSARLRAFAQEAQSLMAARTAAIAALWHAARARGETLGEGDRLPPAIEALGYGGDDDAPEAAGEVPDTDPAAVHEYSQPELTLTREQVEKDLRHAE